MFLKFRNIHSKISVLGSLFNKVAELQACNFVKKWLQHRCFPVNTANLLRTFYTEHLQWLVLQVFYKECFPKNFTNFTIKSRHRSPFQSRSRPRTCNCIKTEGVLLWILWNFSEQYYANQRLLQDDKWCCGK